MAVRLLCTAIFVLSSFGHAQVIYKLKMPALPHCPYLQPYVFKGYMPANHTNAGAYVEKKDMQTLSKCVEGCCENPECNVIFMFTEKVERLDAQERPSRCYHITCINDAACVPVVGRFKNGGVSHLVLVRPRSADADGINLWRQRRPRFKSDDILPSDDYDSQMIPSAAVAQSCEFGIQNDCSDGEECVPVGQHSRNGMCQCLTGLRRNEDGACVPIVERIVPLSAQLTNEETKMYSEGGIAGIKPVTGTTGIVPSSPKEKKPPQSLLVSVVNKELRLPDNKVSLSAFVVPSDKEGTHYTYEWTLLSKPAGEDNSGVMSDQNQAIVKLSRLTEGLYTFKVSVTSPQAYGEALANVTVLPEKRINKAPLVVITPNSQIVKSPNRNAVLDGSDSRDDDRIVKWHWDLQQGPIPYKPHLNDSPTLQLEDLVLPGNYTFRLTVTDSDGASNSTTANITVQAIKDYPPEANAGGNIIVHLPVRNLTLNGNMSSDDHGIVSWEWTKSPSDQDKKAVDMQDTRTPYLHLSNMEEGMYTFVLKVTDNANQTGQAEVHVFVKPPANKPPVVNAGANATLYLPQSWVILDGSKSTSEAKIASWKWEQVSGPPRSVIKNDTSTKANATSLSFGNYTFRLTATDDSGNNGSGTVFVTVLQNENSPPKANAGGDQSVVLPVSLIVLDGSLSTDDVGIEKWQWSREPNSLAIGSIVEKSDSSSILMLTGALPGRYIFKLKVTDAQGASSEDSVSVIVKPDPHRFDLVELALNIEGGQLIASQAEQVQRKLSLLLNDECVIQMRELRQEDYSERAIMVFYVEDKKQKTVMPGVTAVRRLKQKLAQDSGLLELSVGSIQTQICQNNCSGHGVCDKASRLCMCEAFWMENLVRKHFGDGESNCDWSILYVIVGLFVALLLWVGAVWAFVCCCQKMCSPRSRPRKRYSTINVAEKDSLIPPYSQDKTFSDTDTDSDVVFDSQRSKSNGVLHNGFHSSKLPSFSFNSGRRIKT